jgi:hypothetical protein
VVRRIQRDGVTSSLGALQNSMICISMVKPDDLLVANSAQYVPGDPANFVRYVGFDEL